MIQAIYQARKVVHPWDPISALTLQEQPRRACPNATSFSKARGDKQLGSSDMETFTVT